MTDIAEKGGRLEKAAYKICDSHEEAVAALAVAQSLVNRGASQYDVLQGTHLPEGEEE